MPNDKLTTALLKKGLEDVSTTYEEKNLLQDCQRRLLKIFRDLGNINEVQVSEVVSLAITHDEQQYQEVLSSYLLYLEKPGRIISGHHLQGLTEILNLAPPAPKKWLDASYCKQILSILLDNQKGVLLEPVNKNTQQRYQALSLLQQLLFVINYSETEITQQQKEQLEQSFKKYEDIFKAEKDEIGLNLVGLAQQGLLHTLDDKASLLQRTALGALSAFKNITVAAAALGATPVTFGLSSLGAIGPALDAAGDISSLVKEIYKDLKDKRNTQEWYNKLIELRSLIIVSAYSGEKNKEQFAILIKGLIALDNRKDDKNKNLKETLVIGVLDTLTQILVSFPQEQNKYYQEHCYELFKDCVNNLADPVLTAKILASITTLMKNPTVNQSFIMLCMEYLDKNTDQFMKLPLTKELIDGIGVFYQVLQDMKQIEQKNQHMTTLQQHLSVRLVQGYLLERNIQCLDQLCHLEINKSTKDEKAVKSGVEIIRSHPDRNNELRFARERAQESMVKKDLCSTLMLAVWATLLDQQRNQLSDIFAKYEVDIFVKKSSTDNTHIFGEVRKLIVAYIVDKQAVVINKYPQNDFELKAYDKLLEHQRIQSQRALSGGVGLAAKVDFMFCGVYVNGVSQGLDENIIRSATQLARAYLSETETEQSAQLSGNSNTATGSTAVERTFLPSGSMNYKKGTDAGLTPTNKQRAICGKKVIAGEDLYVVTINYDGLSKSEGKELQETLEGKDGLDSATQVGKEERKNGLITEIAFNSESVAENLVELMETIDRKVLEGKRRAHFS